MHMIWHHNKCIQLHNIKMHRQISPKLLRYFPKVVEIDLLIFDFTK